MLAKTVHLGLLLDFYGPLLTEKQRLYFTLYHQEDMSLGEIAQEYGVTRQAVYDILRRSAKGLLHLEEQLGVAGRYAGQKAELEEIRARLQRLIAVRASKADPSPDPVDQELVAILQLLSRLITDF